METFNEHDSDRGDAFRVDRRTALKWVLAAAAALQLPKPTFADSMVKAGYGKDPDQLKIYKADSLWPLTLSKSQRATATVLSDVIIPADAESPAASAVGVVDFVDEWISAPYPDNVRDKPVILEGLAWIDAESQRRFKKDFAKLSDTQRVAICDDISAAKPKPELAKAAEFFTRYRSLTVGGFYTTPVGMKGLGYVGNVALTSFEGPPVEVLKKLGLA
jgi:hypothetical protein